MSEIKIGKKPTEDVKPVDKLDETPDENGFATFRLSAKTTVKVKGLNGLESLTISRKVPADTPYTTVMSYRALWAVKEINGVTTAIPNLAEIEYMASKLTEKEMLILTDKYTSAFLVITEEDTGENLKN